MIIFMLQFYQLMSQTYKIFNPIDGSNQIKMNILYNANSFLIIILAAISYKSRYQMELAFLALIFASLKTSIRIYDFDNTSDKMDGPNWYQLRIASYIGSEISYFGHVIFFQHIKYSRVWFVFHLIVNNFSFYYLDGCLSSFFLTYSVMFTFFFNYLGQNLAAMINTMISMINENSKFKSIFDNLDESIIIIR